MLGKYCSNPPRVLGRLFYSHALQERATANPRARALSRLRRGSRALDHGAALLASVSFRDPRRLAAAGTPLPSPLPASLPRLKHRGWGGGSYNYKKSNYKIKVAPFPSLVSMTLGATYPQERNDLPVGRSKPFH